MVGQKKIPDRSAVRHLRGLCSSDVPCSVLLSKSCCYLHSTWLFPKAKRADMFCVWHKQASGMVTLQMMCMCMQFDAGAARQAALGGARTSEDHHPALC
jgi:hypothetical protein